LQADATRILDLYDIQVEFSERKSFKDRKL